MRTIRIGKPTADASINIALDTMGRGKQALLFVGTRPSAEKTAEELAKKVKTAAPELERLALDVLESLARPTKQCERLARCVRKGVAFHHSGLTMDQKTAIEQAFREGKIKVIACTPTLAVGVDLPAFRAVIRDLKRFGQRGMAWIPVLEYLQMAGRAGRPRFDTEGEAIVIASSESEQDELTERYVRGEPEEIFSKLAVEPVLRVYVLSTIATGLARSLDELHAFFMRTFWGHQFKDAARLRGILQKMVGLLRDWGFIAGAQDDFQSADELDAGRLSATEMGRRVSELYIDPLTAHGLLEGMKKAKETTPFFAYLHLIAFTLEMRPLLRVKASEAEAVEGVLAKFHGELLVSEPTFYDDDYDEFLAAVKTATFFDEWADEKDEEFLLEQFNVRPGEIRAKLERADWLLFASIELARMATRHELRRELQRVRVRLRYGVKEELLPLLRLKGIGRVRARKLFSHGIRDLGDVKKASKETLGKLIGDKLSVDIAEQVSGRKKDKPTTLGEFDA